MANDDSNVEVVGRTESFVTLSSTLPLVVNKDLSVLKAQELLLNESKNKGGCNCPCCGSHSEIFARTIDVKMAVWLAVLVKLWKERGYTARENKNWVDIKDRQLSIVTGKSGDYAKLRYWNFVETPYGKGSGRRGSGKWRPTKDGGKFVLKNLNTVEKKYIFHDQCVGQSKKLVSFEDCLDKLFTYQEVMDYSVEHLVEEFQRRLMK